jgi:hypothetical protein
LAQGRLLKPAAFVRNPPKGGNQRFVDRSRRFGLYNRRLITRFDTGDLGQL